MSKDYITFTVDVEDWYQVENLKGVIGRDAWEKQEARIEGNILKILDLLDVYNSKATFFVLGYIAKKHSQLIKEIHERGHEVASHGFNHELIYNQNCEIFRTDVKKTKDLLEDITGENIIGYRAPAFSITDWALDVLKECGYVYDSSFFPFGVHDRYGKLRMPFLHLENGFGKFENGLLEVSLPTLKIAGVNMAWAGGGYFRLMPYALFKKGIKKILKANNSFTFYIHPWEIDWLQPRINGIKLQYKIRHYINLKPTYRKLHLLAEDFLFNT
ncbi:MAG TPA: DUF3473 domain-containing protein, partial [Candidatus Moranbacteria bacterium]|nr:DUF3473 domain-containing protein [Candidatus Moranbacteria bacterium]